MKKLAVLIISSILLVIPTIANADEAGFCRQLQPPEKLIDEVRPEKVIRLKGFITHYPGPGTLIHIFVVTWDIKTMPWTAVSIQDYIPNSAGNFSIDTPKLYPGSFNQSVTPDFMSLCSDLGTWAYVSQRPANDPVTLI